MSKKGMATALIALVASVFSAQAVASDKTGYGWYLGTSLGHGKIDQEDLVSVSDVNFTDSAFSVHAGYSLGPHLSIEADYADLGQYSYTQNCPIEVCVPEHYPESVRFSANRLGLSLVGNVPLSERFEAYAKLGIASAEVDTEADNRISTTSRKSTKHRSNEYYGAGLRLRFERKWSLRLQWDRTPQLGDHGLSADTWWFGAEYRFGRR